MLIEAIPETYRQADDAALATLIRDHKRRAGDRLLILTHHYQRMEVVAIGDFVGDSYLLARTAAERREARDIVFCGVHFMAEAADILTEPEQTVYLPNATAGCPMADMAPADDVLFAWDELKRFGLAESVTPVSYMNSAAYLKAFCGRHGGLICTSSNAGRAFDWAFARTERVLFFPDQHLGRNTALAAGLTEDDLAVWDNTVPGGGVDPGRLRRARVILWKGHCHVHGRFLPEHVDAVRARYPGVRVVVHPECTHEVVRRADAVGSTSFIVRYVAEAGPGSVIAVGTELNLIARLAAQHPDRTVLELSGQNCPLCSNMFRTTLADVAYCLDRLGSGNIIRVPDDLKEDARIALERMLELK